VLGAARFGIVTIGVADDQSATNVLMVRAGDAAAVKANPVAALKGQQVLITVNTTVDYVLQSCLRKWGLTRDDLQVVNLAQSQILSAVSSGEGRIMGLWAPNNYLAEERLQTVPVCSGQDAGVVVPGNVVVRDDYLKDHPDAAARYLAVMLRGFAWMKSNRAETLKAMERFYKGGGSFVSDHGLNAEIDRRPVFGLDEQVALFDRSRGPSKADGWYDSLAAYLQLTGTIDKLPDVKTYLSDAGLKRILADAKLSAFARNQ
jgi:NitT/TauT family transport system substrate-binding protein